MAKNYQYGNGGATPLQNELREDLLNAGQYQQTANTSPYTQVQPQQISYETANAGSGKSKKRRGFLVFGITCLITAVISMVAFAGTSAVSTSPAAAEALQTGVSATLPVGVRLASGDDNVVRLCNTRLTLGDLSEYDVEADAVARIYVKSPIPGDVNHDGEVTIADANTVIIIIINGGGTSGGHNHAPSWADDDIDGDVNGDGEINISDVNSIINIIIGT